LFPIFNLTVALNNISGLGTSSVAITGLTSSNAFEWDVSTKWNVINASVGMV